MGNWIEYRPLPKTQYSKAQVHPELDQRLKKIQQKHLNWVEKLCEFWSEQLKLPVELHALHSTAFTYGEFMDANDREAPIAQIEISVGTGLMHWYFDYGLAQALLERSLGGRGYLGKRPEAMTALESAAFQTVLEQSLPVFSKQWGLNLNLPVDGVKTPKLALNPQISNQEPYHLVSFEIKLGHEAPARMTLGYTEKALEELTRLWDQARSDSLAAIPFKPQTAQKVLVPMTVCFGTAEARLREVAELQVGDIIVLKNVPSQPVKVLLGDQAKLLATPGNSGRRWSVQIQSYEEEEPAIRLPQLEEHEMVREAVNERPLYNESPLPEEEFEDAAENPAEPQDADSTQDSAGDSIWDDDDDFSWDDDADTK